MQIRLPFVMFFLVGRMFVVRQFVYRQSPFLDSFCSIDYLQVRMTCLDFLQQARFKGNADPQEHLCPAEDQDLFRCRLEGVRFLARSDENFDRNMLAADAFGDIRLRRYADKYAQRFVGVDRDNPQQAKCSKNRQERPFHFVHTRSKGECSLRA